MLANHPNPACGSITWKIYSAKVLLLHDGKDVVLPAFFSEYREGLVKLNSMTQAEMLLPKKHFFFFIKFAISL